MHDTLLVSPPMYNISKLQHDLKSAQEKILELERKMVPKGKPELDTSLISTHDKVMVAVAQDNNPKPDLSHLASKVQTLETLINTLQLKAVICNNM